MGRKILSVLKKDWQLWIMILPAIVYIIIFCYGPMYGIQLAFRKYDFSKGLTGGDWVGFKYFIQYFESPMFWTTLRNTFIISFFTLICGFPAPILLALVVNSLRQQKLKKVVQTAVYMPYFISTGSYGCHTPDTAFPFYRCGQRSVEKHASDTTFHQPSGYTQCFRTGLCFVRNLAVGRLEQHYLHCGTLLSGRAAV